MKYFSRVSFLAFVASLALALTSCGGGGEDAPASSTDTLSADVISGEGSSPPPAEATKTDLVAPSITAFSADAELVNTPSTVTLRASVSDPQSGVLKVEFYEVGKPTPIAIDTSPPFVASIQLGWADNGEKYYYVRAFDAAMNSAGAIEPNIADNTLAPLKVQVAVPDNTLTFVGSLKSETGYAKTVWVEGIAFDPYNSQRFFTTSSQSFASSLAIDYLGKSVREISGSWTTIVADPKQVDRLIGASFASFSLSGDAGLTWTTLSDSNTFGYGDDQISWSAARQLKFSPTGHRLYAYSNSEFQSISGPGWNFAVSADNGVTWTKPASGLVNGNGVGPIAVSAAEINTVYALQGDTLYRSSDAGQNFTAVTQPPLQMYMGVRLAVDSADANGIVVAGTSADLSLSNGPVSVFRSTDGGASWTQVVLPDLPVSPGSFASLGTMFFSPFVPGLAYLALEFGEDGGSVLRSKDGGATWTLLSYFDPEARGFQSRTPPYAVTAGPPDVTGAISLLVGGGSSGVRRFIDRP